MFAAGNEALANAVAERGYQMMPGLQKDLCAVLRAELGLDLAVSTRSRPKLAARMAEKVVKEEERKAQNKSQFLKVGVVVACCPCLSSSKRHARVYTEKSALNMMIACVECAVANCTLHLNMMHRLCWMCRGQLHPPPPGGLRLCGVPFHKRAAGPLGARVQGLPIKNYEPKWRKIWI